MIEDIVNFDVHAVCRSKIRFTGKLNSHLYNLVDILREQALKSMKRKPTPERESESERKTRDVTPEPDNIRTRAESPSLGKLRSFLLFLFPT